MKGTSLILVAVALIAIAADFRAEGQKWQWDTPTREAKKCCTRYVGGLCFKWELCGRAAAPTISPTTDPLKDRRCIQSCQRQVVPSHNPVCGIDGTTYVNLQHLKCVRDGCGKSGLRRSHYGICKPLV